MRPPALALPPVWVSALALALVGWSGLSAAAEEAPVPPFYHSAVPFRAAIDGVETAPLDPPPSGVTVPHHALVLDLIAGALSLARGGGYERIVLISPDHFRRTGTAAAVATRDFLTVLGPVPVDRAASRRLAEDPLVSISSLASHEHGFRAILPFLAEWFPGVPVVTLAVGIRTTPGDWRGLADALDPLVTEKTLVIQSTDFSHYLTPSEACGKDAETLAFLARGDPDGVVDLDQPDHIDSKAAQWIQMTLQQRRGASVAVVDNRNSAEYATDGGVPRETTSYVTQVWRRDPVPASALPGEAWYFGGDFHLGRGLAALGDDAASLDWLGERMRSLTGGRPLILNLEGVLVEDPPDPESLHPMQIVMRAEPTLDLLERWNVAGVVLANNHTLDLGPQALVAMTRRLREAGLVVIGEGELAAFPGFDLFAASDVRNRPAPARDVLRADGFPVLSGSAAAFPRRPRLAFLHWGAEYRVGPDERQRWLARTASRAGFDLILGAHGHVPSPAMEVVEGIPVLPGLGNLLFDQSQRERGGVLLEVRFFRQGTFATRMIPTGNLYREWRRR
jgi:poly-gamma-glutamate synthesis protein (capsule biosynthesis protein)